jgi:hypothetical protein
VVVLAEELEVRVLMANEELGVRVLVASGELEVMKDDLEIVSGAEDDFDGDKLLEEMMSVVDEGVIDAAELLVEEGALGIEMLVAEDTAELVTILLVGDAAIIELELLLFGAEAEDIIGLLVVETDAVVETDVCEADRGVVAVEGVVELSEGV